MFIKLYAIALPVFLAFDGIWLGLIAKDLYRKQIGFLMGTNVNWIAVVLAYTILIAGLVIFAILPAIEQKSWTRAVLFGALFGLVTYDFTNLATLKNWPWLISLIDLMWGVIVSASVSVITYFIANKIGLK